MAVPETWVQGGLCRTMGALPHAANPSLLSPKPAHLAPNQGRGKPPQCLQQLLLPGSLRVRLLLWFSEGSEVAAQCGGVSSALLYSALQPACAFSCFVLKYPLVSFFTSYSLYPKLCISPLNGVIFLIAGRALLLDMSLLLVLCRELREHTSSCRQAGVNHPVHLQPVHILKCAFSQSG